MLSNLFFAIIVAMLMIFVAYWANFHYFSSQHPPPSTTVRRNFVDAASVRETKKGETGGESCRIPYGTIAARTVVPVASCDDGNICLR